MQSMHAGVVRRLLAGLGDLCVDFLARLVDDLLDPPRMDSAVGDELLERQPRDLAADRIEARNHDRVGRVVDDDVHAGGELERADVSPLAPDDPPLHFVVRQRHGRHGGLGGVIGGDALDRQRDDLLRLALGVPFGGFPDLANPVGRVGLGFFFHPANQLVLRVLGGHAGHLLEPAALVADELLELLLALGDRLFAATEVAGAPAELFVALLEHLELAVEHGFPLGDAPLFPFDFLAPTADLLLEVLAQSDQLFFPGDDGGLAKVVRFSLGVSDDSLRGFLGGGFGGGLTFALGAAASRYGRK